MPPADQDAADFFLPCLLQRWRASVKGQLGQRTRSTSEDVRDDIRENLEWLLNCEAPRLLRDLMLNSSDARVASGEELPPDVRSSVLCFGIPAYSGRAQSGLPQDDVAEEIRQCILSFEPRIDPERFEVVPVKKEQKDLRFNKMEFRIRGLMWPRPLQEFELRTEIDLESGQARLSSGDS